MKRKQDGVKKQPPVKVAKKNLHCYSCGGLIRKGSAYLRKDFVKMHYKLCPIGT
jgi:hypothetical protein